MGFSTIDAEPLFKETARGGQWSRRKITSGESVGESKVLHRVGIVGTNTIWEVQCPCGSVQLRPVGQINQALRRGYSILCPECVTDYRNGRAGYAVDQRVQKRLQRVLNGGPVWSDRETLLLQKAIRRDLEEEFGEVDYEEKFSIADMQVAHPGHASPRNVRTSEEQKAISERRLKADEERKRYRRAVAHAKRQREQEVYELERVQTYTDSLARKKAKEEELERGLADKRAENWERVIAGEDIVNPDKVTKKSVMEFLKTVQWNLTKEAMARKKR